MALRWGIAVGQDGGESGEKLAVGEELGIRDWGLGDALRSGSFATRVFAVARPCKLSWRAATLPWGQHGVTSNGGVGERAQEVVREGVGGIG